MRFKNYFDSIPRIHAEKGSRTYEKRTIHRPGSAIQTLITNVTHVIEIFRTLRDQYREQRGFFLTLNFARPYIQWNSLGHNLISVDIGTDRNCPN